MGYERELRDRDLGVAPGLDKRKHANVEFDADALFHLAACRARELSTGWVALGVVRLGG